MSCGVLLALLVDEALALGGIFDLLDLVEEDRVDRRLRPHHRDLRLGERQAGVRLERGAGHRVEARAVGLANDHRELRDRGLGDGADHLRAVADDPLALDFLADHEARHVREEEQWNVEGVAGHDEAGRLVGGVDEEDAALHLRLVGHDPDHPPVEARVADHDLLRPAVVHLEEGAGVHKRLDQILDVEGVLLVVGHDLGDRRTLLRLGGRRGRWILPPVRWACRRGSAGRGRSRPRRSGSGSGRPRKPRCACGRRPSPRGSPSPRSPSPPSAANPGTWRRCRRA